MFQCKELRDPCLRREQEGSSRWWQKPRSEVPEFCHPGSHSPSWFDGQADPLRQAGAVASQSRPLAAEPAPCPQQPSLAGTKPRQRAPRVSFAISAQLPCPGSPERSLWQRWPQHCPACQGTFLLSPDTNSFPFPLWGHLPQVIGHSLPKPAWLWPRPKTPALDSLVTHPG